MKICIKCNEPKALELFSKDSSRHDNKQRTCKACAKSYRSSISDKMINYRKANSKKNNEYHRIYRKTDVGKINLKKASVKRDKKFPNAYKCRYKTVNLIKLGELIRPSNCDTCGSDCKPNGHHCDYNDPLDIMWLCASCHRDWHKVNTPLNRVSGIFTEGL